MGDLPEIIEGFSQALGLVVTLDEQVGPQRTAQKAHSLVDEGIVLQKMHPAARTFVA